MALTSAQAAAFKVASGDVDLNVLHLSSLGLLIAVLFLWAAWGLSDVWSGWRNGDVRESAFIWFTARTVLLLVASIWMFAVDSWCDFLRRNLCVKKGLLSAVCA